MLNDIEDNAIALHQGITLLQRLSDTDFCHREPACYNSTIGEHMRHNIDHYLAFFDGLPAQRINYDHRQRDPLIETDRDHCREVMAKVIDQLTALEPDSLDLPLSIQMDTGSGSEAVATSSPRRELQFLLSHTVHHYALVAIQCHLRGIALPDDFGVAPSTLKHRQSLPA